MASRLSAILVVLALLPVKPAMAIDQGTFVGGFAEYQDVSGNWHMACGDELHLVDGARRVAPPRDFPRLDVDHTAVDGPNGGIFAFGCCTPHAAVTILYYPRRPAGEKTHDRFLCEVVETRCAYGDQSYRGKVRLRMTPTTGSLQSPSATFRAIEKAWIARDLAAGFEPNVDIRNINFHWHLEMIAAMVPPAQRERTLAEVIKKIETSERFGFQRSDLISEVRQVFEEPAQKLEETKQIMRSAWAPAQQPAPGALR
ncbi:MAG TPA: hypothetical protein VEI07_16280 [Planctomycetaceae bacterium]|nr:hypothetical protein [Planctomycetaceae bacterium]